MTYCWFAIMRAIILTLAAALASKVATCNEKKVVCYFISWAVHYPGNGNININQIDPHLCTHLIYQYVSLNGDGTIRIRDPSRDLSASEPGGSLDGFGQFNRLRGLNPSLRTLICIGTWGEDAKAYSKVAAYAATRTAFVENAVKFVRKYGFDGVEFEWEYPTRGTAEADKRNYVTLLRQLRRRFDKEGLIVSTKVIGVEMFAKHYYTNVPKIAKYSHIVNVMAWDAHAYWDNRTGIHGPVYAGSWENGNDRLLNVNATIHYWLSQGTPAEKLVLGIPAFGRTFALDDPNQNGIGAPAHKKAAPGPYTRNDELQGYNEICEAQLAGGWQVKFQEEQRVPYAFKGNQWVGYDNAESVREKAELINELGLGGAMVWSIEMDDFRGICGEKYPILKTLNRALRRSSIF